jgi:hypothetical protein
MAKRPLRSVQLALAAAAALSLLAWDVATSIAQARVDGPEVKWRFSTWGKRRAFTEGPEHVAKRIAEETGGKFTMEIFYGEALSKSREHLDGLKINAFDAGTFCNFYHPGKNPAFMVFSLPFLPLADIKVDAYVRNRLYQHPALKADMDRWNAMAYMSTLLPQYEFLGKGKPPLSRLSSSCGPPLPAQSRPLSVNHNSCVTGCQSKPTVLRTPRATISMPDPSAL